MTSDDEIPDVCPSCGAPWGPGQVHLSWTSCGCPGARYGGHRTVWCEAGCHREHVLGHVEPAG